MQCPSCGLPDAAGSECPRCGVVYAKLQAARQRPQRAGTKPSPPPEVEATGVSLGSLAAGALALFLVLWFGLDRLRPQPSAQASAPADAQSPLPSSAAPASPRASAAADPPPPSLPTADTATGSAPLAESAGISEEDVQRANALILKRNQRQPLDASDLRSAEELSGRYPKDERVADVLVGVLGSLGAQEQQRRHFTEAQALFRRAITARPKNLQARLNLILLFNETGDFAGAEAAAREALSFDPRNADLLYSLGYALFRQDRNREAAEVLQASLDATEGAPARSLLERLRKVQRDERGMTEQQLAHFHVRYDGEEHEDVGREILRQLERHYATLVRSFDHQPATTIPVILFSREQYFDASGAPAWSGGVFDGIDGRIRIPIGGLTTSLTPEMDATLIHELSHAFINDMTRGLAPREIHEGVAQFMEGKRIAARYTPQQLAAIADGRAGGVAGFYATALAFVEYLVSTRGSGGINELLRAMAETGSVDAAFDRVHGRDYAGIQRAWRERIRQLYGS